MRIAVLVALSVACMHHAPPPGVATVDRSPSLAAMAVVPRPCCGTTFYAPSASGPMLQAEGARETHDIDALWRTDVHDGHLALRMTNEAFATQVVEAADILAVPRPPGTRVLSTGSELWLARALAPPARCTAIEGDCTAQLAALDGIERTSPAGAHELAARDVIELEFPAARGRQGIVIASRHAPGKELQAGGIAVQVPHGAGWLTVGEACETGSRATDVHLIVLPDDVSADRVRLRFPRGGWRIDHVSRAVLDHPVMPVRIAPHAIRGTLGAAGFPIVTQPGDAYELEYTVPAGDVDLFLDSAGHDLEWMRGQPPSAPESQ